MFLATRLAFAATLLTSLAGCQKELPEPTQPVSCTYQLLDHNGRETSVFALGEPIIFRYQVRNHTNHPVLVKNTSFDLSHFMRVSRDAGSTTQLIGRPFESVRLFYYGYDELPAYGTLTFSIPWVPSAQHPAQGILFNVPNPNSPLPAGRYRTSVWPTLAIGGSISTPDQVIPTDTADYVRHFEVR